MMKILLLGSGGREHALAWKIVQSRQVSQLFVMPGNAGISLLDKVSLLAGDHKDIAQVILKAQACQVDLVIIGPEDTLALGVTDALEKQGIAVFGPTAAATQLESSKIYAKHFMHEFGIATAEAQTYSSYEQAMQALDDWHMPAGIVIKVDGLAAGKGVVVTGERAKAEQALFDFMRNPNCSVKTKGILLEKKLIGKEVSAFALCDGHDFITLGYACDYKRLKNGDLGPNTGGMGGYAVQNWPSQACKQWVNEHIFSVVLKGMQQRGIPFKGFLFAGLMIENEVVRVIEFNVRMGDPEAQILLPLIEGDLVPVLMAAAHGKLKTLDSNALAIKNKSAVHVVMSSKGYPAIDGSQMNLGQKINYPHQLIPKGIAADKHSTGLMFIAGAQKHREGYFVNSGGRVLGITAIADQLSVARKSAYTALKAVNFTGAHWRTDIACAYKSDT